MSRQRRGAKQPSWCSGRPARHAPPSPENSASPGACGAACRRRSLASPWQHYVEKLAVRLLENVNKIGQIWLLMCPCQVFIPPFQARVCSKRLHLISWPTTPGPAHVRGLQAYVGVGKALSDYRLAGFFWPSPSLYTNRVVLSCWVSWDNPLFHPLPVSEVKQQQPSSLLRRLQMFIPTFCLGNLTFLNNEPVEALSCKTNKQS